MAVEASEASSSVLPSGTNTGHSTISTDKWLTHLPLMARCNVFNGNNLILWERAIQAALQPRQLMRHLTETAPPATDPRFRQWVIKEEFVFGWILDSLAPQQVGKFMAYETAKGLWDAIRISHSKAGDKSRIFDLIARSYELRQGDKDILPHSSELRDIHTELDH